MRVKYGAREMPSQKKDIFWLLLLLLACMDFASIGSSFMAVLLFFYTAMYVRQAKISGHTIILFLFSLSYFICHWYHYRAGISDLLKYFFFPWMAYMFGSTYVRCSERKAPLLTLTFIIVVGLFVHGTLNLLSYRFFHRVDERHARLAYDIWRQGYVSVTTQGLLFLIPVAVSIGMLLSKNKKWIAAACVMLAISTYNAVLQAHRSLLSIIGIMMIGVFIYLLFSAKIPNKKKIAIILAALLLVLLCIIIWNFNIAGFRSRLVSTRIYRRMIQGDVQNAGGRFDIWKSFFAGWLDHPMGGKKIVLYRNHGFVHNFWLDIYRVVGVFPFLFSIIATLDELIIQRCYALASDDTVSVIIMYCITAAVLLGFMVEPAYIANPYVYYCYLIIHGGIWGTMHRKGTYNLR